MSRWQRKAAQAGGRLGRPVLLNSNKERVTCSYFTSIVRSAESHEVILILHQSTITRKIRFLYKKLKRYKDPSKNIFASAKKLVNGAGKAAKRSG